MSTFITSLAIQTLLVICVVCPLVAANQRYYAQKGNADVPRYDVGEIEFARMNRNDQREIQRTKAIMRKYRTLDAMGTLLQLPYGYVVNTGGYRNLLPISDAEIKCEKQRNKERHRREQMERLERKIMERLRQMAQSNEKEAPTIYV